LQQWHETPEMIESHQVIAPAYVRIPNEDLGNGPTTGPRHHRLAVRRVQIDADLFDVSNATLFEKQLGPMAKRADLRGVHLDGLHARSFSKAHT
jgi:hypothetical protein